VTAHRAGSAPSSEEPAQEPAPAQSTVVATAGHVDHGKSTLVQALTGTDPDRFAEEQERGLTIDLGFAVTTLPSGREISFVDVPGHVRFLKNMLAGVGAVRCCLFVVAATEGWKPQSEEHLRILDGLGVSAGVIALTKTGLADADEADLVALEVADRVAGTFLSEAEVVAVDGLDGRGLGQLRLALDRMIATTAEAPDLGRPRLWVDRSFAARGAGTVVTGTLTGGTLAVDDEIEVRPGPFGGAPRARVRSLQSHGRDRAAIGPGSRVAVNLSGIGRDQVVRGDAVVHPGDWHLTRTFDATLEVLASLDHPVSRRGAHVAYVGSGERPVRLRILGPDALAPGHHGLVRVHLPVALPLRPGDRYVLRESGRQETVGAGEILDVDPVVAASRATPDRSVDRVIAERGWVRPAELERLTGSRREPDVGGWVVAPDALAAEVERVRSLVAAAGPLGLDLAALDDRGRAALDRIDGVRLEHGRVLPAPTSTTSGAGAGSGSGSGSGSGQVVGHAVLAALEADPFRPPSLEGYDRAEVRDLVRRGLVVDHGGISFATSAVDQAAGVVAALLETHPEGVTVGQIREALGTTRKYALPLLAILDGTGRTRRRGDLRIRGPRL